MSEGKRAQRTDRRVPVVETWLRARCARLDERRRMLALRLAVALVIAAVIGLALITPPSHATIWPDPTAVRPVAAGVR
jgi:hypothetical protein